SLARPGGSVTGFSVLAAELFAKRLELLTNILPGASRIAGLWQLDELSEEAAKDMVNEAEAAARMSRMQFQLIGVRTPDELDSTFSAMAQNRSDGLVVCPSGRLFFERRRIVDLGARYRLPSIYYFREFVAIGGLASYGPNLSDLFRGAGSYVGKILKGAKPGDLPIEQPTKFELVINLQTAKALGLTIPQSLLVRADEVIQ